MTTSGSAIAGAFATALPVILAVSAALVGISAIAPKVVDFYKDVTNDVQWASEKIEENNSTIESAKKKLEELNAVPWYDRTSEINEEIAELEDYIEELEKANLELEKNLALGSAADATGYVYGKTQTGYRVNLTPFIDEDATASAFSWIETSTTDGAEALEYFNTVLNTSYNSLKDLEDAGYRIEKVYQETWQEPVQYYNRIAQEVDFLNKKLEAGIPLSQEEQETRAENIDILQDYNSTLQTAIKYDADLKDEYLDLADSIENVLNVSDELNLVSDQSNQLAQITKSQVNQLTQKYPSLASSIKEVNGQYYIYTNELVKASETSDQIAKEIIQNEIDMAEATLKSVEARVQAYSVGLQNSIRAYVAFAQTASPEDAAWAYEKAQEASDAYNKLQQEQFDAELNLNRLYNQLRKLDTAKTVIELDEDDDLGTGSSTEKAKDVLEDFNNWLENQEFDLYLLEKQEADGQTLIEKNKEIQEAIHNKAEELRKAGYQETDEEIQELIQLWWDYQANIEKIEQQILDDQQAAFEERLQISKDYIDDRNFYDNWGADNEIAAWNRVLVWMEEEYYKKGLISFEEYVKNRNEILKNIYTAEQEQAEEAQRAAEEARQAYLDNLEEQSSIYEKFFSYMTDRIDEEIEKLEDEYEVTEKFWDDKIDAIQEANEELEQQIALEEAMDDLARARQNKVMVYKDGRFQYISDIDQVSEAQANLEKLEREEALRQEVANLEQLKEQALKSIQDQIDDWEDYKKAWSGVVDHYEEEQDRLLLEQELGIELEGDLWKSRLDSLQEYANQYQSILNSIVLAQQQANNQLSQMQNQQWQSGVTIGGGGGSSDIPYNWTGSGGLSNWVGGTQTNEQGWVMDGKVAAIIDGIGGGAVPVWYDPSSGKVMSSGLKPGDVVLTQGGYFQITGGSAGKYTSKPWTPSGGGSSGGGGSGSGDEWTPPITSEGKPIAKPGSGSNSGSSGGGGSGSGDEWTPPITSEGSPIARPGKYASGTLSASGGISLVGENGPELRLLNSGDGILPADATRNLWSWSNLNPESFIRELNGGSKTISIMIDKFAPVLSNITNGEEFANYLKNNFWQQVVQYVN